mgnify:CR=1
MVKKFSKTMVMNTGQRVLKIRAKGRCNDDTASCCRQPLNGNITMLDVHQVVTT